MEEEEHAALKKQMQLEEAENRRMVRARFDSLKASGSKLVDSEPVIMFGVCVGISGRGWMRLPYGNPNADWPHLKDLEKPLIKLLGESWTTYIDPEHLTFLYRWLGEMGVCAVLGLPSGEKESDEAGQIRRTALLCIFRWATRCLLPREDALKYVAESRDCVIRLSDTFPGHVAVDRPILTETGVIVESCRYDITRDFEWAQKHFEMCVKRYFGEYGRIYED